MGGLWIKFGSNEYENILIVKSFFNEKHENKYVNIDSTKLNDLNGSKTEKQKNGYS